MDNYFDPIASPNLGEDDPLRTWAQQLQSDPDLPKLMATDPQAAIDRMKAMGLPPPPGDLMSFTDGLSKENMPGVPQGGQNPPLSTQVIGGAPEPLPVMGRNGKLQGNLTSIQGQPPVAPSYTDPAGGVYPGAERGSDGTPWRGKPGAMFGVIGGVNSPPQAPPAVAPPAAPPAAAPPAVTPPAGSPFDPPMLEPEVNPHAGPGIPLPERRPPGATDISAAKKKDDTGDALNGFAKSLQGVKPVPPPAPNFVGTPSVRQHGNIAAPNLQALLSMVGQPGPSPLGLTLGRLLATGKA